MAILTCAEMVRLPTGTYAAPVTTEIIPATDTYEEMNQTIIQRMDRGSTSLVEAETAYLRLKAWLSLQWYQTVSF